MKRNEIRYTFRKLPFLESQVNDADGMVEFGSQTTRRLLVWHPEAIDWIFRSDRRLRHVASHTLSPLLGRTSLLWAEGSRHAAYRRVLGSRLHRHQLQEYHHIISEATHAAIDGLARGTGAELIEWTQEVTLDIIGRIVLGNPDPLLLKLFRNRVDSVLGSRIRTLASRYLRVQVPANSARAPSFLFCGRQKLDEMLLASVKATANATRPTLAALLLADDGPLGVLDDRELVDQTKSLLFAGYESTASATGWTLYWLGREDGLRRDVVAELTTTSHDGSDPAKVPLLQAVIQESMRLSPPAIVAGKRLLTTGGELLGKPVAAGTIVTPCIYLAHRSPDIFAHPLRFDPDRFLGNRISNRYYFPFGGGTRRCLGHELAMLTVRMITAAVLRRCELPKVDPEADIPRLRGPIMAPTDRLSISVAQDHMVGDRRKTRFVTGHRGVWPLLRQGGHHFRPNAHQAGK